MGGVGGVGGLSLVPRPARTYEPRVWERDYGGLGLLTCTQSTNRQHYIPQKLEEVLCPRTQAGPVWMSL